MDAKEQGVDAFKRQLARGRAERATADGIEEIVPRVMSARIHTLITLPDASVMTRSRRQHPKHIASVKNS